MLDDGHFFYIGQEGPSVVFASSEDLGVGISFL
jgi:hypothetical protein